MATTKLGDITLAKKSGTDLILYSEGTYVATDVSFSLGVQEAVTASDSATADVDVNTSGTGTAVNVGGSLDTKTTTQPSSGYYLRMDATGSGNSKVTSAGWVDTGSLASASTTATVYFPVDEATASVSGTNTVTPSASISGSNVTLSNTNNGISVTSTGGGTASATVSATSSSAGFVANNTSLGSDTIPASSMTTTASTYISGVTLNAPSSGTNVFSITVPNGAGGDVITFTFTVDSSSNVVVTET